MSVPDGEYSSTKVPTPAVTRTTSRELAFISGCMTDGDTEAVAVADDVIDAVRDGEMVEDCEMAGLREAVAVDAGDDVADAVRDAVGVRVAVFVVASARMASTGVNATPRTK